MLKLVKIELLLLLFCLTARRMPACGPDFPNNLLDTGDAAVLQSPVADFRSELVRMKLVPPKARAVPLADGQKFSEQSTELEMADLAAALKREKIAHELATVILQSHLAERMKLNAYLARQDVWTNFDAWVFDTNGYHALPNTNPPPVFPDVAVTPGLPREFAGYFAGAIAWHNNDALGAELCWQQVLALPVPERHFKSTWAAYMIAQFDAHLPNPDDEDALKYFEQVRALARNGFADSAGLATASVGGEAQIWLGRKNYEQAIELYLEQFAAGDESAVQSLRFTAARAMVETNSTAAQLKSLALNPRTRRVITAYLISRNPYTDPHEVDTDPEARQFFDRTDAWLAAVEVADIKDVESASSLALAAYQASRMDSAQRWVRRSGHDPVAQWLQAKLFLRDGDIAAAAKLLASLSREFPREPQDTSALTGLAHSLHLSIDGEGNETVSMDRQVLGELGVLHLTRREYTESLDALLRSGYWMDAAYVAEDVLTTAELKVYVDRNWPSSKAVEIRAYIPDGIEVGTANPGEDIRWLLARRLARESMADVARDYYPTNQQANFETCRADLLAGRDENLPLAERARSLFAAAVITHTNGMELFGTEVSPDWAIYGGDYDWGVSAETRSNGNPHWVAPTPDEAQRAARHRPNPDTRFHYRFQAADLALEAAKLMPDNSEETARMLCTAGSWIKYLDPTCADVLYKALVRRCRKTAIGAEADALRWFPVLDGAGDPIPFAPRGTQPPLQPRFNSIKMFDREHGWAQNGCPNFPTNDWRYFYGPVLRTTNGGLSWETVLSINSKAEVTSCFYDADTAWAVSVFDEGTNVTVMHTPDGGRHWYHNQLAEASPIQDSYLTFSDADNGWLMLIPDHGMSSFPGDLYRTQDGGEDWRMVNSTTNWPYEGENYTPAEFARQHPAIPCGGTVVWRDATNGWLWGSMETTSPRFLFITQDGGLNWQLQTLPLPDSLHDGRMEPDGLPKFFPGNGSAGIMGATFVPNNPDSTNSFRVIYATRDGGQTWQPTTPVKDGKTWDFISDRTGWMWSQEPAFYTPWTAPVKGTLYRTDDGGSTWQPVSVSTGLAGCLTQRDHVVQLDFVDQNCGWALTQDWNDLPTRLWQTTDGGRTWNVLPMKLQR